MRFSKWHALGNAYLLVERAELPEPLSSDDAHRLCDPHGGVGADLMLGNMGVAAELTDFVSKGVDDKWNAHDAFLMVGLKVRLGR